jgi:hypothetical protein
MPDVIVVPDETAESGSEGVAFAAGVAAAEAAQAGEEAEEAAAVAEVAAEEAAGAVAIAGDAASTAWAAREDVDQLRAEFSGSLEEIRGMLADLAVPAESELTPERVERENGPGPEDDDGQEEEHEPKRAGKYGSSRWFGR